MHVFHYSPVKTNKKKNACSRDRMERRQPADSVGLFLVFLKNKTYMQQRQHTVGIQLTRADSTCPRRLGRQKKKEKKIYI